MCRSRFAIVFSGPSGIGKSTIIKMLLSKYPNTFCTSVSHTTRKPRKGEVNGVDYIFISVKDFEQGISKRAFMEYAQVHSNYYGTSISTIENIASSGKIAILDLDINGLQQMQQNSFPAYNIFFSPKSMEELEARLRNRKTELETDIELRIRNARHEIDFANSSNIFDAIIVNEDSSETVSQKLPPLLKKWFPLKFLS